MVLTLSVLDSGAVKEQTIEKGIDAIADAWRNTRFELFRYMKGTEDRGWILKSTEDITMRIDDNSMNLQSMQASPASKPFLELVRKWEKDLATVGEVTQVWMQVQRKWMYLESIFIGSDDIRMQLPEEAKRFDRIDKQFKKIMNDTVCYICCVCLWLVL